MEVGGDCVTLDEEAASALVLRALGQRLRKLIERLRRPGA